MLQKRTAQDELMSPSRQHQGSSPINSIPGVNLQTAKRVQWDPVPWLRATPDLTSHSDQSAERAGFLWWSFLTVLPPSHLVLMALWDSSWSTLHPPNRSWSRFGRDGRDEDMDEKIEGRTDWFKAKDKSWITKYLTIIILPTQNQAIATKYLLIINPFTIIAAWFWAYPRSWSCCLSSSWETTSSVTSLCDCYNSIRYNIYIYMCIHIYVDMFMHAYIFEKVHASCIY